MADDCDTAGRETVGVIKKQQFSFGDPDRLKKKAVILSVLFSVWRFIVLEGQLRTKQPSEEMSTAV